MIIGDQTWVFETTRIGLDPISGEDEYETAVTEPGDRISKPVRYCLTSERAHEVHQTFVNALTATTNAVTVASRSLP